MKMLSPTDALFLMAEHRRQPMHIAGLQIFALPDGAPKTFIRDLVKDMRRHSEPSPPYNQRPVFRGTWFWRDDDHFEIDHHVRHLSLPAPGRIRELLEMVSRLHSALMDRSRPLWEVSVIEGLADGRFAIYTKVHHSVFDGVSATLEVVRSLSEDPNQRAMPPVWARVPSRRKRSGALVPPVGPVNALIHSMETNFRIVPGAVRGALDLLRRSRGKPADATPYQAPPTMFNVPISSSRRFAAQSYSLARIKAVAKAAGGTINDVALAMCSGAIRSYLESKDGLPKAPLISMVPVSVRAADSPEGGNQVSVILANLATHIVDPAERLQAVMASTRRAKDRMAKMSRVEQLAYAATGLSPMAVTSILGLDRIRPAFNVVISNVPGSKKPLYLNGAMLEETYPISIPIDGQALNITLTSYCDSVAFGYTACRRSVPNMQRLLDFTEQALSELEAAVGLA